MSRILLVEDDPVLGRSLSVNFKMEGYEVVWARGLSEAQTAEAAQPFDLVVLDWELPDGVGLQLCERLRARGSKLPVLILTARADEDSAVHGLQIGANDYIRKPFGNRELLARIRVALKEPSLRSTQIRFAELLLLPDARRVYQQGKEIELNRREFDLLAVLMRNAGGAVARESLVETLSAGSEIFDRTIDSHVSHLRAKLKGAGVSGVRIASVYGIGYRLESQA